MKNRFVFVMVYTGLCAPGCGKSNAASIADAQEFVDAYCAEVVKCCNQHGLSTSGQSCKSLMSRGTYNATAGKACLAEIDAQVASGTFCDGPGPAYNPNSPCHLVTQGPRGNVPPGGCCNKDMDCAASAEGEVICAQTVLNAVEVRKCQVQIAGKNGDTPCVGMRDRSGYVTPMGDLTELPARGYVCDTADGLQCANGACIALTPLGGTCRFADECVPAAYCDYSQYRCAAQSALGATCPGMYDGECVAGAYCDPTTNRCTPQLPIGSTCINDECLAGVCGNNICEPVFLTDVGWFVIRRSETIHRATVSVSVADQHP